MRLNPFVVTPRAMHEAILMPQFADYIPDSATSPSSEDGDWQIMTDVVYQRPILDLKGSANILKRRDATCKLIPTPVGKMSNRYIRTEKLYGFTEDCREEFYQGCFQDYSNENWKVFGDNIMPFLEKGVATDVYTNKYFGDLNRVADVSGVWSWNKFDGVFAHIGAYIASGVIPSSQAYAIASGAITPANAKAALDNAYAAQDGLLSIMDDSEKVIYVNKKIADAYWDYLVNAGVSTIQDRQSGAPRLMYRGIEIRVKKWDGIMAAINGGTVAHAVILTVRSNFLFATDNTYGGGPLRNEAIRVFYDDHDNIWKYQIHIKAGTEIVAPQHLVIGITTGII